MKRVALMLLTLSSSALADVYRWTDPATGAVQVTPTVPPYPVKEQRIAGKLPNGYMVELTLDANAPEVKALIEKRKAQEAQEAKEKAAREAEKKRIAEQKAKEQLARDAQLKAIQEQQEAVRAEKQAEQERQEAELRAIQEQQDAIKKAESEKEFKKKFAEAERKIQELEKRRDQECPRRAFDIKIGMSKRIFELCMAMEPDHINTTETAGGVREQWVYPTLPGSPIIGKYYYFTNGILTAIQRQ